ncbi:MAG: response regulator transcription factor [Chloroflexi bacterium]|nr:response regulator transcription factor [Chloroflexota bacterium]
MVVEDDTRLLTFLAAHLRAKGYHVELARDGQEALERAALFLPDLVVLDLGLPKLDGLEVLRGLRQWTQAPVIILSARGEERTKVEALDLGADDYLTKPFSPEELLARIRAGLRRAEPKQEASPAGPLIQSGDLVVDLANRVVKVAGREVSLTRTEYELLRHLVLEADKVLSHRELLRRVWGPEYGEETEYLRTFIKQLRRKLERDPSRPRHLLTQPGVGYRFRVAQP